MTTTTAEKLVQKKRGRKVPPLTPGVGLPIRADETYTFHQLRHQLQLSRTTLFRWITSHGLSDFATKIGGKWLITGQGYMDWVNSRRGKSTSDESATI